MAKSIFSILDELETDTSVPDHGSVTHTLPRNLLPTAEQFEDADSLLDWAEENEITHACLQKGIQKFLIDLRAIFKSVKKDEVWNFEKGQKAVDDAEWKITSRPNVNDKEAVKKQAILDANLGIAKAMKATKGISEEMILNTLTESCGADLAKEIIASLE